MERILKILIISIITFVLAIIAITFFTNLKKKSDINVEKQLVDTVNVEDTLNFGDDIFSDNPISDINSDDTDLQQGLHNDEDVQNSNTDLTNYIEKPEKEIAKMDKKTVQPVKEVNEPSVKKASPGSIANKTFMVVAGNFIDESNANTMKKKLNKMGYSSEIVNFEYSQYYTVLAGRYSSDREARQTVSKLSSKGIDAYVHRRKN